MLKKGSKLYSILTGSCPKCQKESMYPDKNLLHISKLLTMNENCSHCNFKYQIEPSFFYGAMYVSYGLNVAVMMLIFLICFFGFHFTATPIIIAISVSLFLLFPIVTRLSRNIYINIYVDYDEDTKK